MTEYAGEHATGLTDAQLEAALRAAAQDPTGILLPMVLMAKRQVELDEMQRAIEYTARNSRTQMSRVLREKVEAAIYLDCKFDRDRLLARLLGAAVAWEDPLDWEDEDGRQIPTSERGRATIREVTAIAQQIPGVRRADVVATLASLGITTSKTEVVGYLTGADVSEFVDDAVREYEFETAWWWDIADRARTEPPPSTVTREEVQAITDVVLDYTLIDPASSVSLSQLLDLSPVRISNPAVALERAGFDEVRVDGLKVVGLTWDTDALQARERRLQAEQDRQARERRLQAEQDIRNAEEEQRRRQRRAEYVKRQKEKEREEKARRKAERATHLTGQERAARKREAEQRLLEKRTAQVNEFIDTFCVRDPLGQIRKLEFIEALYAWDGWTSRHSRSIWTEVSTILDGQKQGAHHWEGIRWDTEEARLEVVAREEKLLAEAAERERAAEAKREQRERERAAKEAEIERAAEAKREKVAAKKSTRQPILSPEERRVRKNERARAKFASSMTEAQKLAKASFADWVTDNCIIGPEEAVLQKDFTKASALSKPFSRLKKMIPDVTLQRRIVDGERVPVIHGISVVGCRRIPSIAQEEADAIECIQRFVESSCVVGPDEWVPAAEIADAVRALHPALQQKPREHLAKVVDIYQADRHIDGSRTVVLKGISLKTPK